MKIDAKTRVVELFHENLHMAATNQTAFRKKVMNTLIRECSTDDKPMTTAAAATHYNNAKKAAERAGLVSGLGRSNPPETKAIDQDEIPDDDCYTVAETVNEVVTRTCSFLNEDLARKKYKERLSAKIPSNWHLIKGLGPNVGDTFRLAESEVLLEHANARVM